MILNRENAVIELKDQTIKEYGGIEFQEIAFAQKINLRGNSNNKSFMTLQGKLLDAVLPTKSNTYTNNGKIKILWLGPNEWLIVDEDKKNNELFLKLEKSDNHEESAITDVSENRTIIRIRGKKIFNLLEVGSDKEEEKSPKSPGIIQKIEKMNNLIEWKPFFGLEMDRL